MPRVGEVAGAEPILAGRPTGAAAGILGLHDVTRGANRRGHAIEDLPRLRREVGEGEPVRVGRRPREAPVIPGLAARGAEPAHRVHLRRDVRRHLVGGHHRPAPRRLSRPGAVRERAVRVAQVGARGLDRGRAGAREHELVLQVVVEVLAAGGDRNAGDRVAPHVAVHLLRPVGHVRGHVRPERRIGEPVLNRVLVDGDVAGALAEADDQHRALRRSRAVTLVQAADELADVRARVPVPAADRRRELVQRPGVPERDVVARGGHVRTRGDARRMPGVAGGCHPARPGREVHLRHRVKAGAERPDTPRLVRTERGLVRDERRDRDVVLGARRSALGELRRQPEPVRGGVEDRPQRPACGRRSPDGRRARAQPAPESGRLRGLERGDGPGLGRATSALGARERRREREGEHQEGRKPEHAHGLRR